MNLANTLKNIMPDRKDHMPASVNTALKMVQLIQKLKRNLLIVLLFAGAINAYSQVDRDFWFTIPKENNKHGDPLTVANDVSLKITAQALDANVTISMPLNGSFTIINVFVPAGTTKSVELANSWAQFALIYANPGVIGGAPTEGTTNNGLHVVSDNDITVYYDYNNQWNRDLWSLKGKNALGTEFYTPFQYLWINAAGYANAYSDIDIVATVNNTVVTITPSVASMGHAAGTAFTVTLNAGQTYSLVAKNQTAAAHLIGTHITSTQPIAVTVNDDSVTASTGGCLDVEGDQLVPVTVIGSLYLVMCGTNSQLGTGAVGLVQDPTRAEQVFIVATQANTVVTYQDRVGTTLRTSPALAAGGKDYLSPNINIATQDVIYINATHPIYVYHITGIGCETGGALLPPITNCTGSQSVSFYRASDLDDLTLNLMIPYNTSIPFNSPTQSYNFFTITYQNGTTVPIPGAWFEPVPNAGWAVLIGGSAGPRHFNTTNTFIPKGQAVKIENPLDFFHLGITNGTSGATDKYGYFSSFNSVAASVRVAQTEFPSYLSCFGDTVTLQAYGGISYQWHYGSATASATTYLSDPTSATPQVFCPPGTHYFYVTIHRPTCFSDVTLPVTVTVLPEVKASFETDKTAACSPVTVQFTNTSIGANKYEWTKAINNGIPTIFSPASNLSFTEGPLSNITTPYAPKNYVYYLKASISGACKDSAKKTITVYPQIKASILPNDTTGCAPLLVKFRNMSSGNVTDTSYYWNFGDQNTSVIKVPSHVYNNYFTTKDTTYPVQMVATSPYFCRDTANQKITVHPYIKAGFTVDTVKGCSPFLIKIYNNSQNRKAIGKYFWDFNYKNPAVVPRDTLTTGDKDTLYHSFPRNLTNAPVVYKILLTINHIYGNGCPDTISRIVTVYPESKVNILNPDTIGCNKLTVKFRVSADAAVTLYSWNYGDSGTSNEKTPTHEFVNLSNKDSIYKVSVRTYSPQYCSGYDTMLVTVHANIDPQFALDVPKTCAPYNATFRNNSIGGITSYSWDYGDGTLPLGTSSAASFQHHYDNNTLLPVTYNAKLVISNSGGCKDSASQSITLYPEVNAQFSTIMSSFCSPRTITFSNHSSVSVTKYYWNFGDNTSSIAKDTTHNFVNNTQDTVYYHPYLVAISDYNCRDSTAPIPVLVYPYIEANFALDTAKGCDPLTVKITKSSLGPYDQESWNFGDGTAPLTTIQPQSFSHIFYNALQQNDQAFKITLNIKYKGQCQTGVDKWVTVDPTMFPKVSVNKSTICNGFEITFRDSTTRNFAPPYRYQWDFGDNGTAAGTYVPSSPLTVVTKHQYQNYGPIYQTLNAKYTGYTSQGCSKDTTLNIIVIPDVKATFSFNNPDGCSPFKVTLPKVTNLTATWVRFWDDQNNPSAGYPVTSIPATMVYLNVDVTPKMYTPKLKVAYLYPPITGSPVCPDSITHSLLVYPKATAYFAAKDSFQICHPDSVHFANRSMIASTQLLKGDNRLSYKWSFGDNGSSSDFEPAHLFNNYSFDQALVDNVWLKVISYYGCTDSLKKTVTIYPKPRAVFDIDNTIDCPPFKVQIDHHSTAEAGTSYGWKFHYGNDTTTKLPVETLFHTFTNSGINTNPYIINMVATTPHNCSTATSQEIDVYPAVVADFEKDTAGCHPFSVSFMDKSKQADYWYWTFGDGGTSKSQSPKHTFLNGSTKDSSYTVTLAASSKYGCSHDTTHTVTVYPQPVADFEADPSYFTFSPTSNIVTFTNLTNPGNWNFLWNFGDLLPTDNTAGPVLKHDYQYWGYYDAKLNVWSNHCSDSISRHITIVAPKPIAEFSASADGCVPLTVTFTELTKYGTSWNWDFGDGGTFSGQNPPPYEYVKAGKFNVKLTVSGDGGTNYAYKDIDVYPKPTVNFDLKPSLVMLTETKTNGESTWGATVNFYNKCMLGNTFIWDFGDSTAKSNEAVPTHTYRAIGYYTVKLGAWTVNQCYDQIIKKDTIQVLAQREITFPNAFMPVHGVNDGTYIQPDTKNDVFHPSWQGVVEYHLEIYDRWGEKLFESDNIDIGWNGYFKGKLCKTDVYIWKAKGKYADGGTFDKAGNVTLLQ